MTNFDNLKKLENEGHFNENAFNNIKIKKLIFLFNLNNKWEDSLDNQIVDKIEKNFSNEMKERLHIKLYFLI